MFTPGYSGCPFWGSRCLFAKQEETLTQKSSPPFGGLLS